MLQLKQIILGSILFSSSIISAQTLRQELAVCNEKSAGNYFAYPMPSGKSTPAPAGYSPFYISHYGRHGSRYMLDGVDAKESRDILRQAEREGKLSSLGKQTLLQLDTVINEMDGRYGELTQKGQRQHRGIARRMFASFPEIFSDSTVIDARSTDVPRVVLSMGAFCQQLMSLNPSLKITNTASKHDKFFMCNDIHAASAAHKGTDGDSKWQKIYNAFNDSLYHSQRLMDALFTKKNYLKVDKANELSRRLFNVACDVQDMDNIHFSLYKIFTNDEVFDYWQAQNAFWFGWLGLASVQDVPYYQMAGNLLRNIIDNANIAIASKNPSVTLRFGHDTGILPLLSLMRVGNAFCRVSNPNDICNSWVDFKLVPMCGNLQLVFYRNVSGTVLVKALLNEEETTLPVKSFSGPYYLWSDVMDYYEEILSHIPDVKPSVSTSKH